MSECNLTQAQLKRAHKKGEIAAVAATGGTIRFVFIGGIKSGYLISDKGAIKRFASDSKGYSYLEKLLHGC